MTDDPSTLVSTEWLAAHLDDPDLRLLDASWHLPGEGRDARAEYEAAHIPGARFFDVGEIADRGSNLPNMAPSSEKFQSRMRSMGVGDGHQVVIYDSTGILPAARVWWLFRLMGKADVAVLDGGLPKWQREGRPVDDMAPIVRDRHMSVVRQNRLVRDVTQVAAAAKLGDKVIVDARAPERFRGDTPEPRDGMRAGHIPGARNLPYATLFAEDGTLKSPDALRAAFEEAGVDLDRPVITTCGSGMTAAALALALARTGHDDWSVYDGSWSEWGSFEDLPVATGPA